MEYDAAALSYAWFDASGRTYVPWPPRMMLRAPPPAGASPQRSCPLATVTVQTMLARTVSPGGGVARVVGRSSAQAESRTSGVASASRREARVRRDISISAAGQSKGGPVGPRVA